MLRVWPGHIRQVVHNSQFYYYYPLMNIYIYIFPDIHVFLMKFNVFKLVRGQYCYAFVNSNILIGGCEIKQKTDIASKM